MAKNTTPEVQPEIIEHRHLDDFSLVPTSINYPKKFSFWDTKPRKTRRLQIINENDFPQEGVLRSLEIATNSLVNSFGITDEVEIARRLELVQAFLADDKLAEKLAECCIETTMPVDTWKFLDFFCRKTEHNPYWESVYQLKAILESIKNPPKSVLEFLVFLNESLVLENDEKNMVETIEKCVSSIAVFSGLASFTIHSAPASNDAVEEGAQPSKWLHRALYKDGECFGHNQYSASLADANLPQPPKESRFLKVTGIEALIKLVIKLRVARITAKCNKAMVIQEATASIRADLASGVSKILSDHFPQMSLEGSSIRIHYNYSKNGLYVDIYGMKSPNVTIDKAENTFLSFVGYTNDQWKIMKEANSKYSKEVQDYRHAVSTACMFSELGGKLPGPLVNPILIESPNVDKEYRWFVVSNMYATNTFAPIVENLKRHRKFVYDCLDNLHDVRRLSGALKYVARKLGTSFCQTEITGNGNMLSFEGQIFPVQLIAMLESTNEKVIPINSLPEIKGNLLGFTGYHGGGKTQTSLAILVNIWLVQSGIPPLGNGVWRQNVKKAIGGVFIDSDGARRRSTCQLLLEKMTTLLNEIKQYNPHDVVVILDELGTGTQEDSGIGLGQDILSALHRLGVSTLFTTQIRQVAEFARDNLGARCFKFNARHGIEEGIGDGGMAELRKKIGFDKALK